MHNMLKTGHPQQPLLKIQYTDLRLAWDESQTRTGVSRGEQHQHYTIYQCRHGGPSHDLLKKNRTLPEVWGRGRWAK